jgi:hypothetical protein
MVDLGTPGPTFSSAVAVSPGGQVVGQSTFSGEFHAALWEFHRS